MKKNNIYFLILIIVIVSSFIFFRKNFGYRTQNNTQVYRNPVKSDIPIEYPKLTIGGHTTITVEIVKSREDIARGLGGRDHLAQNHGMLFDLGYENTYPRFWMKDMMIPLDFIWIDNNIVVDLTRNIQPPPSGTPDDQLPIITPQKPVDLILEVNSGFIDRHSIEIGDEVFLKE